MKSRRNMRSLYLQSSVVTVTTVLLTLTMVSSRAQEMPQTAAGRGEFSATDVAAANQLVQTLGVADWLGPLAPVALSPFFAIACLSGMALYGQAWVSADNAFLGRNSPLNNPYVFWTFLILTVLTSIPRFTKVSKPVAQAVDQVEAWAGIITLLTLRLMMGGDLPEPPAPEVVQAGLGTVTVDTLLMVAAVINIFVINAIKFFFEVLIWITPVPAIDAMFEVANKSLCVLLMAVYGYSPVLATAINLVMFAGAAIAFRWVYRRQLFFRTMIVDAVWQFVAPPRQGPDSGVTVFPVTAIGDIPPRAQCRLVSTDEGWLLGRTTLLGSTADVPILSSQCALELEAGYMTNSLKLTGALECELSFSRWYNAALPQLADTLGAHFDERHRDSLPTGSGLRAEFG